MAQAPPHPAVRKWHALGWRHTVILALAVLLLRVLYLALLCPYDLVGDEAQYWDWSRPGHLDMCYYSKGPGVAWAIAASTHLLGSSAWTVRLPAALASFLATLAIARLAAAASRGDQRIGFYAALLFILTPAYLAVGFLMTIDGPFLLFWILALWAAWHAFQALEQRRSSLPAWVLLGLALGVGALFKYTILLLIPGLLLHAALRRRAWRTRTSTDPAGPKDWKAKEALSPGLAATATGSTGTSGLRTGILVGHLFLGLIVFAICLAPVVIWNQRHDWPTVAHLAGNINLPGSDYGKVSARPWWGPLFWPLEMVGTQIGLIGPVLVLCGLGIRHALRQRWHDGDLWPGRLLLICSAIPILLFYLAVSLIHAVEGNWPIAAYPGLMVLAAQAAAVELPRWKGLVAEWLGAPDRPWRGFLRRRPETAFQIAWHWTIGYGLGAAVLFTSIYYLGALPGLDHLIPRHRFAGYAQLGRRLQTVLDELPARLHTDQTPVIMTSSYWLTAELAFYTPSHPRVSSAAAQLGGRQSSYDYFADTRLDNPALKGRPVVIVDNSVEHYRQAFFLGRPVQVDPPPAGKAAKPSGDTASHPPAEPPAPMLRIFVSPRFGGVIQRLQGH